MLRHGFYNAVNIFHINIPRFQVRYNWSFSTAAVLDTNNVWLERFLPVDINSLVGIQDKYVRLYFA